MTHTFRSAFHWSNAPLALLTALLAVACASGEDPASEFTQSSEKESPGISPSTLTPPPDASVLWLHDVPSSDEEEPVADDGASATESDAAGDGEKSSLAGLDDVVSPQGTSCGGIFNPCGIVYNRSGGTLQLCRDSGSHFYCDPRGPYRNLPDGANSNAYGSPRWPDVDCLRSNSAWIYTNARWYPPGEWVRIWTSKWVY